MPRLLSSAVLVSALAMALGVPVAGQPPVVQTEITTASGTPGVLMRPFAEGPYPAVLHLHGSGDTLANNLVFLRRFARAGYVALGVEYRQTGAGADLEDALAALDYLEQSRYVSRGAVALNGFSRGARLALRIAVQRDVRAVSATAARTTAGPSPTILDEAERLRVPVLLQHGTDDPLVPHEDSVRLAERLRTLGRRVEFFSYPGADHNYLPWNRVYDRVVLFFREHVR